MSTVSNTSASLVLNNGIEMPAHVECEFRRYLECGIRAHGFA